MSGFSPDTLYFGHNRTSCVLQRLWNQPRSGFSTGFSTAIYMVQIVSGFAFVRRITSDQVCATPTLLPGSLESREIH